MEANALMVTCAFSKSDGCVGCSLIFKVKRDTVYINKQVHLISLVPYKARPKTFESVVCFYSVNDSYKHFS